MGTVGARSGNSRLTDAVDHLPEACSSVFGLPAYRRTQCCSFCELFRSDVTFLWIHPHVPSLFIYVKVGDSNRDSAASSPGLNLVVIVLLFIRLFLCTTVLSVRRKSTVEPAYNDIGLYDLSSIASDILWYQSIPHC
jgi:hypothetical protein